MGERTYNYNIQPSPKYFGEGCLCGSSHQTVQRAFVYRLQGSQTAEVGRTYQVRIFPEFYCTALLQQRGHKLGAEIVVLPAEWAVEIAGQNA
jgi:hypothetical protein